jgi:hypothetical protein
MDLGAFLEPGVYPVYRVTEEDGIKPWGHVYFRKGRRLSWLCSDDPLPKEIKECDPLLLALEVPDHKLLSDGSLSPAVGEKAPLHLACEVRASRIWSEKSLFVLRFKSLIRLF